MDDLILCRKYIIASFIACIISMPFSYAQKKAKPVPPISFKENRLSYVPDSLGNRIPDFSYAGYKAGASAIPEAAVKVVVPVKKGDATNRIQSAIDYVSSLQADKRGIRGAVLLEKGTYEVEGSLKISTSGVVFRGSGMAENGTVLLGTGKSRETLVVVEGSSARQNTAAVKLADIYHPVNTKEITLAAKHDFKAGQTVIVHRPSTQNWIEVLGTEHFGGGETTLGWKPGDRDLEWDRTIVAVNGNKLTLDAPITTALDPLFGGGTVFAYKWPERIREAGVENMLMRSTYDAANKKDEDHRWMAITMNNVVDAWVRQIKFEHFAGSAVQLLPAAKRVTVEDCISLSPVSEIGGQRRYTFYTLGQQTLFQRCYAEDGYHDFAVGFCATGPNVFVQCESSLPHSFSGAIDSWASGVLFDIVNVDGQALSYMNRSQDAQGAGWSAANSVFWQCTAALINNFAPPTANNWAFGSWAQFSGNGYWNASNEHISPRSLYYTQLIERVGTEVGQRTFLMEVPTEASSSPKVETAAALTAAAQKPAELLKDWIAQAGSRTPISIDAGARTIDQIGVKQPVRKTAGVTHIKNGWLLRADEVLKGARYNVPWWRGTLEPVDLKKSQPAITRFVPGRTGLGLTDNLEEVTDKMKSENVVAIDHNYGLWYERRRDDHERIRRMDGEVWAPFYDQPFARSGEGLAWDGLSKYDLTKYNAWYWSRLRQFADLADEKGLILIHQNYFQHNIIEAGAHYSDSPWRTANNVNNPGFPEPVPYAGDKRIFMAEQFYDVSHPERRALHRAYIRQCLDNFRENSGVIQLISAEYTGPLHFVEFWLDVIKEWEAEKGKKVVIGLSTTKDVQDAILADAARASVVNLIDIRYWHYQADGSEYAPKGGQNLAPRQHARLMKPKKTSFEQVYRAVSEYRKKYPSKAVMYSGDNYDSFGWAAFMAGGSLPQLPASITGGLLAAASQMSPAENSDEGKYVLEGKNGIIVYSLAGSNLELDLRAFKGSCKLTWINPKDGQILRKSNIVKAGGVLQVNKPSSGESVLWVSHI
ncbi:hypothetical protein B0I27_101558 [Arcticibacter pallidicorallinus]|uniref:DUF6298 domain-containing protein n=1 Tax=Arcticibacter pallidicorallinus TaxID=1259464 RepID=A0A2T0UCG9_9SPHI|nr:DUF6298 domain-containing protein [Arcticibacter pallidicorallinus]PRY55584.1 hypothetical protein B0I27_101558 [Arcticibacter pallidicorallinus]